MDKGRNTICKDTKNFIRPAFFVLYPQLKTKAYLHHVPESHCKQLKRHVILKVMAAVLALEIKKIQMN
jgi:hypothetical protein